ncbi:MAG: tRNA pseudouridine(55) synthase TruB [Candidatus Gastranaerophilaceae bacterium]
MNIYKPKGITSHDVIYKLRKLLHIKKIGHGGTLDPMAEGVLPVAISHAAKLIDYLPAKKEYQAKFQLGVVSDSYDTECELKYFSDKKVSKGDIKQVLDFFRGQISQKPPIYSAVKKNGKKLYELARQGCGDIEIPERIINVEKIELIDFDEKIQQGSIIISCSKGTYIRSIIHDMGQKLNTGAVMTALIRTVSGGMNINNSVRLEQLSDEDAVRKYLINPSNVINFKNIEISKEQLEKVKHGMGFKHEGENGFVFLCRQNVIEAFAEICNNRVIIKKVFSE